MITYGRSVTTIAEQLFGADETLTDEVKIKKAQKVYDSVLNAFPKLKTLMVNAQNFATKYGYTETILGRRRHIPDMQLPRFEFKAMKGYVNPDVDPLDPTTLDKVSDIPDRIVAELTEEFSKYKYFGQIARRTKELYEEGIKVINNSSKINDASRRCVNCVSLDTEILTVDGWKRYDNISVNDPIYSFNLSTQTIESDRIQAINVSKDTTEVVRFNSPSFEAVSTMNHRWVVCEADEAPRIKETYNIYKNKWPDYPILRVGDNTFKDNPNYSDSELKLIGWLLTDGHFKSSPYTFELYQSERRTKNQFIYQDMIQTLNALGLQYKDGYEESIQYHTIYLNKCDTTIKWMKLFPERELTAPFISELSQRQASIVMWSMIEGDGTLGENHTNITYTCSNLRQVDAFQYLAFIAGYATNFYETSPEVHNSHPSSNICYASVNNAKPIQITKPYYTVSVLRVQRAQIYPHHKSIETTEGVWCPTTSNGTWVARYNGKVFITGNSIIQGSAADMTKLAMLRLIHDEDWKRLGGRLLLPVHDELICEVPMEHWKEGGEVLSNAMVSAGSFLPFTINCDVTTSIRWYGLEYPCPYIKPETSDLSNLSVDDIKWYQYHLVEMEYVLPTFKDENGDKPKGDAAVGVNGIDTEEFRTAIANYIQTRQIDEAHFRDFIEHEVLYFERPKIVIDNK